jgi:hypothetical protein
MPLNLYIVNNMWFDIQGKDLKVQGFKRIFKVNLEKPLLSKGFQVCIQNVVSSFKVNKRPTDPEAFSGLMWNYRRPHGPVLECTVLILEWQELNTLASTTTTIVVVLVV